MRIRTIKPEFWISESIGRLSRDARLLYIGLWSFSDDSGNGRGALNAIAGALFPYDPDAASLLPGWFAELEREGMVRRYKGEDGNCYYDIPKWLSHQKINRPSKRRFPAFAESSVSPHGGLTIGTGNREPGTGMEEETRGKPAASTGGDRPAPGYEVPSNDEVIAWTGAWQGEMASGAPKMPEEWVLAWLSRMVGRREWPADWRRKVVLDWRVEFRTWSPRSAAGSSGMGPKSKNGAPELKGIGTVFASERPTGTFKPAMI